MFSEYPDILTVEETCEADHSGALRDGGIPANPADASLRQSTGILPQETLRDGRFQMLMCCLHL